MRSAGCYCGNCGVCRVRIREQARKKRRAALPVEAKRKQEQSKSQEVKRANDRKKKARKRAERTESERYRDNVARETRPRKRSRAPIDFFLDGEGHGRSPHLYTYVAAVALDGTTYELRNPDGITTEQILYFLTDTLPNRARLWGFSLGYDKSMWLKAMPRDSIYLLLHPEHRRTKDGKRTREVAFRDYRLNAQSTRFRVRRVEKGRASRNWEARTIWDVFRYFQCSFVKAIETWGVATKEELDFIREMKELRPQFTPLTQDQTERYCKLECAIGIKLVHALLKAHSDIGLETNVFFGPGSTAEKLLVKYGVDRYMANHPEWAHDAVMTAFSGGRFENRTFGVMPGPLHSRDIASAYPYQSWQLPCLQCGVWDFHEGTLDELLPLIQSSTLALTRVYVPPHGSNVTYAPFAFRDEAGSISYPFDCETWVWKQELLAAIKAGYWKIEASELITYRTDCKHKPFHWVPEIYRQRLALGKDGKGLVLKLGVNSLYGKSAQSVGKARFANWVWAGNITSGCRAQILDAMGHAPNLETILSIATDGIVSSCPLTLPEPLDSNTGIDKALGSWEFKKPKPGRENIGRAFIRPGLNTAWPPDDEDSDDTRARGVGRKVFTRSIKSIVAAIDFGATGFTIRNIERFVGHKSSIRPNGKARDLLKLLPSKPYLRVLLRESDFSMREDCCEWILDEHELSFNPHPKRVLGPNGELLVRSMNGAMSRPYKAGKLTPENQAYRDEQEIEEEQP